MSLPAGRGVATSRWSPTRQPPRKERDGNGEAGDASPEGDFTAKARTAAEPPRGGEVRRREPGARERRHEPRGGPGGRRRAHRGARRGRARGEVLRAAGGEASEPAAA